MFVPMHLSFPAPMQRVAQRPGTAVPTAQGVGELKALRRRGGFVVPTRCLLTALGESVCLLLFSTQTPALAPPPSQLTWSQGCQEGAGWL